MITFIDCGFHKGESILRLMRDFFSKIKRNSDFKYWGFEPNPDLHSGVGELAEIINKLVSDHNGIEDFYITPRNTMGSSLYPNTKKQYNKKRKIKVECVDLSEWIRDNINKDDFIVLKLNVEGEEYKIIPRLIETNIIEHINVLFVEFHSLKIRPTLKTKYTKDQLMKKLKTFPLKVIDISYIIPK